MNKLLKSTLLLVSAFAVQSFAILGAGFHYSPTTGNLDASKGSFDDLGLINFTQGSPENMNGFGFKAWVDILPLVDIEATFNFHFGRYDAALEITNPIDENNPTVIPLEVAIDIPFVGGKKATPIYANMISDLSVNYPFLDLPVIRMYAGAGVSYIVSTPVLNKDFAETFFGDALNSAGGLDLTDPDAQQEFAKNLTDAIADEGFSKGMGGHVLLGVRLKVPVLPFAAYANAKYHFGGGFHDQYQPGATFEIGAGFGI